MARSENAGRRRWPTWIRARAVVLPAACVLAASVLACPATAGAPAQQEPAGSGSQTAPSHRAAPAASSAGAPAAAAPIPVGALSGWQRDGLEGLAEAIGRQCALPAPPAPWPELCARRPAAGAGSEALRSWIERRFVAWPLSGARGERAGLITGYHEPLLTGSREREHARQVALHRRPADLVADGGKRLREVDGERAPYPARAAIENTGLLAGRELLWLDDPVEAFFLQVQGSGRVRLRDGSVVRVGFADHNGQAYRAIGAELVARGAMARDQVDAPAIKAWLRANPAQARSVMQSNPRYIFFRELPAAPDEGPPGALAVPLTPMRSVATDPAFVPPGALLYLETRYPDDGRPLARAMLSQDRGAAITGGVRADIFFGAGAQAERLAGLMKEPGRLWLLWPRGSAPPVRAR